VVIFTDLDALKPPSIFNWDDFDGYISGLFVANLAPTDNALLHILHSLLKYVITLFNILKMFHISHQIFKSLHIFIHAYLSSFIVFHSINFIVIPSINSCCQISFLTVRV
jgi:hypothetical protein